MSSDRFDGASKIPDAFLALYTAGRFDYWGAPYRSLTQDERAERLRVYRVRTLWLRCIEWDQGLDEIRVSDGADGQLRPGLVRFAGNGYGDSYCWYPRWQASAPEPPVLFVPHDELRARVFARSFGESVLRCLLQDHANWDIETDGDEVVRRSLWSAHAEIIRPYLDSETRARLAPADDVPAPAICDAIDREIAASLDRRAVVGMMQPARYDERYLHGPQLAAAYERSLAFYRELVESEGLERFRGDLERVLACVMDLRGR